MLIKIKSSFRYMFKCKVIYWGRFPLSDLARARLFCLVQQPNRVEIRFRTWARSPCMWSPSLSCENWARRRCGSWDTSKHLPMVRSPPPQPLQPLLQPNCWGPPATGTVRDGESCRAALDANTDGRALGRCQGAWWRWRMVMMRPPRPQLQRPRPWLPRAGSSAEACENGTGTADFRWRLRASSYKCRNWDRPDVARTWLGAASCPSFAGSGTTPT